MDQELPVFTQAISRETKTVSTAAVGLTASAYKDVNVGGSGLAKIDARIAFITIDGDIETNEIRWTVDGTAPVAQATGHMLSPGQTLVIKGHGNITKFRAIREFSADGTMQVTYFG